MISFCDLLEGCCARYWSVSLGSAACCEFCVSCARLGGVFGVSSFRCWFVPLLETRAAFVCTAAAVHINCCAIILSGTRGSC